MTRFTSGSGNLDTGGVTWQAESTTSGTSVYAIAGMIVLYEQ